MECEAKCDLLVNQVKVKICIPFVSDRSNSMLRELYLDVCSRGMQYKLMTMRISWSKDIGEFGQACVDVDTIKVVTLLERGAERTVKKAVVEAFVAIEEAAEEDPGFALEEELGSILEQDAGDAADLLAAAVQEHLDGDIGGSEDLLGNEFPPEDDLDGQDIEDVGNKAGGANGD